MDNEKKPRSPLWIKNSTAYMGLMAKSISGLKATEIAPDMNNVKNQMTITGPKVRETPSVPLFWNKNKPRAIRIARKIS